MNWDIQFTDEMHGWTMDDGVFYTEDGGFTWTRICSEYAFYGYDFHFIDAKNGWMVTQIDGGVARTFDGGYTWELQVLPYCSGVWDVWFSDENNGWAVGSGGIILHTSNGGMVGTDNSGFQVPGFTFNTYPNPFKVSTTLEYQLPEPSVIKLEIYNFSGKLIKELVEAKQSAGIHRITWEAEDKPSGIYFYKLTTDQSWTSGKLVLVR